MLSPTTLSQPYPNPIQLVFTEHLPCSVSKESTYNAGDCLQCRRLPAMQETPVWSLGQENPLEKEMATHSSIFAWEIPWIEEPGRLQFMGSQRVGHDWSTTSCLSMHFGCRRESEFRLCMLPTKFCDLVSQFRQIQSYFQPTFSLQQDSISSSYCST